jgi:hypothetical protein
MFKIAKTATILSATLVAASVSDAKADCTVHLADANGFVVMGTQPVSAYCQNAPDDFYPYEWYGCTNFNGDTVWGYVNSEGFSRLAQGVQEFGAWAASERGYTEGWSVVCGGYR